MEWRTGGWDSPSSSSSPRPARQPICRRVRRPARPRPPSRPKWLSGRRRPRTRVSQNSPACSTSADTRCTWNAVGRTVRWSCSRRDPAATARVGTAARRTSLASSTTPSGAACTTGRTSARANGSRVPRTSLTAAHDLHALLAAAGLAPPYVLVGRSFGGYNVRLFAAAYPSEVQGLVLVETLTPEFQNGMLDLLTPEQRIREVKSFEAIEPPMDELAGGPLVAAAGLPEIPLLVVAGTKWHSGNEPWPYDWPGPALDALWDESQADLASAVPRGRLVVFEGGDHALHFSEPERLASEINEFLAAL